MQAPVYHRSADFSQDERNNAGGRSTLRTDQVDAELDAIALTAAALCLNLSLIQRDDGKLRDAVVELFNLSPAARAALQVKWVPRGLWAAAAIYLVGDMVDVAGTAFVCAVAHVSGAVFATDYAAGRWQIFIPFTVASGLSFAPTATISATNVQAAIVEVDSELRAMTTPPLHHFYGGL